MKSVLAGFCYLVDIPILSLLLYGVGVDIFNVSYLAKRDAIEIFLKSFISDAMVRHPYRVP